MTKQKLILIGGGGHCKSCIDVIESTAKFEILGIIDIPQLLGTKILNYKIIGNDNDIENFAKEDISFLVTIGQIKNAELRLNLHKKVLATNGKFATVIAKTAYVSKHSSIGENTIIMHNAIVNANAKIGDGCIINTNTNIEHDTVINDYCHISTGAIVNGTCTIGEKCFIGSQAMIANNISIAPECIIGAASAVYKNIPSKGTYFGNPAKLVK